MSMHVAKIPYWGSYVLPYRQAWGEALTAGHRTENTSAPIRPVGLGATLWSSLFLAKVP
jgi:hypothetical protein